MRQNSTDGVMMAVLALGGLAALKGYQWWQAGETWKAVALDGLSAPGAAVEDHGRLHTQPSFPYERVFLNRSGKAKARRSK